MNAGYFVPGDPAPKGSMRSVGRYMLHDNPNTLEWSHRVTEATKVAVSERAVSGPIRVRLRFMIRRPKGHTNGKTGKTRQTAPRYPAVRPDIDKLARAVLDAITQAGVWLDDGQVVRLECEKAYDAEPGVHVWLEAL